MIASMDCFFNAHPFQAAWNSPAQRTSPNYHIHICQLFEEYTEHLAKDWSGVTFFPPNVCTLTDIVNPILSDVSQLSDFINKAIECFLRGHLSSAIQHFDKGMGRIKEHLDNIRLVHLDCKEQSTRDKQHSIPNIASNYAHSWLYRARKLGEEEKNSPTPETFFHVPFEKREKVSACRFSLPGVPCLYLGSSQGMAVWEVIPSKECSKQIKNYKDIFYAKFTWNTQIPSKFIELQITPSSLKKSCKIMQDMRSVSYEAFPDSDRKNFEQYVRSYLACWPLQLACSIPVKHRDAVFKEEYIIPQLLMLWLQQNLGPDNFHGVCYRTTRLRPEIEDKYEQKFFLNYALPTKSLNNNGYCDKLWSCFSDIGCIKQVDNLDSESSKLKDLLKYAS